MRPPAMPMVEAERMLGPAYWDEGDASWESTLTRWMEDPARHHKYLEARVHPIFGGDLPERSAHYGRLMLRGLVYTNYWTFYGEIMRHGRIHPESNQFYGPWSIGEEVKVVHGGRTRVGDDLHVNVELVASRITAAAQLVLWPDHCWWLWYRDEAGLRLFYRPERYILRWTDATGVLDAFAPSAWGDPEVLEI